MPTNTSDRVTGHRTPARVARVFSQQPHRIAAAWRRTRSAVSPGEASASLLDGLAESFIHELGLCLEGEAGSPWGRTRGVLRLCVHRGARALHEEFASLRRCLVDAVEVLGGGDAERSAVNRGVDEALDSAVALQQRLADPHSEPPRVAFGGLVVEYFEALEARPGQRPEARRAPVH